MEKYKELTMTSPFERRKNPITGQSEFHRGIDYRPNSLKEVFAGFSAVYFRDGFGSKTGTYLQLRTKLKNVRFYINLFHLESIHNWIKAGNKILRPEDSVAIAGTSGESTGIHIHYEISTYEMTSDFAIELKNNIKYYESDEKSPRIFYDPIGLWDYCIKNKIYI